MDGIGPTLAERIVEHRDAERRVRLARRAERGRRDRREAPRGAARGASALSSGGHHKTPMARGDGRRGARPGAGRVAGFGRGGCRRGHRERGRVAGNPSARGAGGGAARARGGRGPPPAVGPGRARRPDSRRRPGRAACGARHAAETGPVRIVRRGRRELRAPPRHAAADPGARLGPVPARRCAPARSWRSPGGWARSRRRAGATSTITCAAAGWPASWRSSGRAPPAAAAAGWRGRSTACAGGPSGRLERGLAPSDAALLRGMVLGQDEAIDPVTREDFRASGLAHLLAVSGQNVMLLVALAPAAARCSPAWPARPAVGARRR